MACLRNPQAVHIFHKTKVRGFFKRTAQMEEDAKKTINPMELWLRRYGVTDKDKAADEYAERTKMESREYLRLG